jgi:hypothetical protein
MFAGGVADVAERRAARPARSLLEMLGTGREADL